MKTSNSLLETYQRKRDFKQTPEPRGKVAKRGGRRYLIQKHAARRLHYDFRLELDGVLKSWAVTKGPSVNPADKRLAVRTEDHPVDYAGFEGVIPSGYGAGTVMLWDRGEWQPTEDPEEGMERGVLKFNLHGERLHGGFALVKMKPRPGEKRENWLLIKERDEYADTNTQLLDKYETSVISDRDMDTISVRGQDYKRGKHYPLRKAAAKRTQTPNDARSSTRSGKHRMPTFVPPQLCTLRDAPPEGDEWLHEVKYDGYRIQALLAGGDVKLITRSGKNWTEKYPAIANRLRKLDVDDAIIDGELVALDAEGHSKFSLMPKAAEDRSIHLVYFAFDLLQLNGESLKEKPLTRRKELLEPLCGDHDDQLRFSSHIEGDGERVMKKACALHLEGIVSKKSTARYQSGRGHSWIKSKCIGNDEFVIAGFRRSDKPGRAFSSLLLGEFVGDDLHYRGRVGTGFDDKTMALLAKRMRGLQTKQTAFVDAPAEAKSRAIWLQPKLVGQVSYTERTDEGRLRHPSFLGLREDKSAPQVKTQTSVDSTREQKDATVAGVRLSHPDKVMFPPQGATKRRVAQYYAWNAHKILTYLAQRPLSFVRCPQGHSETCFFQRHHTDAMPDHIKRIDIREKEGKTKPYLLIDSAAGLVEAAQIGVLELHLWGVRADRVEYPERLIFDLDPAPGIAFDVVRDAAVEMRDVLDSMGLQSFALLTGGKGIHVIVPLARRRTWAEVKAFSRGLALQIANAAPDRYVATASKKKRTGKIFIDWLRNERGGTAVAPYSLRARENAPVATPVSWRELGKLESAAVFTIDNIRSRLSKMRADPWRGYHELRQSLTNAQLDSVR